MIIKRAKTQKLDENIAAANALYTPPVTRTSIAVVKKAERLAAAAQATAQQPVQKLTEQQQMKNWVAESRANVGAAQATARELFNQIFKS